MSEIKLYYAPDLSLLDRIMITYKPTIEGVTNIIIINISGNDNYSNYESENNREINN